MSNTVHKITIKELFERPEIRNDFSGNEAWMNKMTDAELDEYDKEIRQMCIEDGVEEKYPDLNAAMLSRYIDRGIIYNLFYLVKKKQNENE